jgi:hypothetical protein
MINFPFKSKMIQHIIKISGLKINMKIIAIAEICKFNIFQKNVIKRINI